MGNSKRAKVPSSLKGKPGHVQTQTLTLSEQDSLKRETSSSNLSNITVRG